MTNDKTRLWSDGFMITREIAALIDALPNKDAGTLIDAAVVYYLTGETVELPHKLQAAFDVMRDCIDGGAYGK